MTEADAGLIADVREGLGSNGGGFHADVESLCGLAGRLDAELAAAHAEAALDDILIAERNRLLDALPCKAHGQCVPHALDEIARLRAVEVLARRVLAAHIPACNSAGCGCDDRAVALAYGAMQVALAGKVP